MKNKHHFGFRLGNVNELPLHIREKLNVTKISELDIKILDILESLEGIANLDEILVALFRLHSITIERPELGKRMMFLTKTGKAFPVTGKRGAYCNREELQGLFSDETPKPFTLTAE